MKALRKPLSLFMAMLMCLGIFAGTGTTAFAAGETMTTYMVEFPRASDPNKAGWGHSAMNFLGGWSTGENNGFTIHTQDSFNGKVIYCIEPGVGVHSGDQFTGRGEDFWDDYPSDLNPTIPPDTIKEYIGRIMTYGWQGNASTSWMTDDPEDASKMAGAIATQLLVWETVVGERDSQFNHVDANAQGKNNIAEYISPENPLYSEIFSQYSAIESAVKRHTMLPSFFSSTADAGAYELKWDGQQYSLTLTDENNVLGDYTFSSSTTGLNFSVDGNQLTITSAQAIKGSVTIKAEKVTAQRSGVVVWTDGVTGGGKQDFATYGETVSDQMVGYLNLEVKTGNMKLIKTSEDGQVAGINFTITGEGYSATKTTNEAGEIDISDLNPGVYTVTEQSIDKYEPQETQRVTIVSGQTATVNFNNKLKRGSLEVTKTSEDGLVEGMTFHLYGTSLSGQPVDEYAVTDSSGVARFENVLIGTGYVLEEVDTPIRYVVPDSQTATIEWGEITQKSVNNVLKKFRVTVTKSDVETGTPQGDGSLAGAVYGLYKGDTLIDSFTTDENGQFTTGYYVCDSDWTVREISPSEGYLLDSTIHKVGAEPELYTIELNDTANDVTEQIIKGNIAIIKHVSPLLMLIAPVLYWLPGGAAPLGPVSAPAARFLRKIFRRLLFPQGGPRRAPSGQRFCRRTQTGPATWQARPCRPPVPGPPGPLFPPGCAQRFSCGRPPGAAHPESHPVSRRIAPSPGLRGKNRAPCGRGRRGYAAPAPHGAGRRVPFPETSPAYARQRRRSLSWPWKAWPFPGGFFPPPSPQAGRTVCGFPCCGAFPLPGA